ncbi:MAG: hypothetical protein JSV05_02180 [Candidatus Bathyarchaeota archaeon]|nr:MAG: hypothetical protein JSV05_02180 [Candidatus Bathyarchaeota archaeon]
MFKEALIGHKLPGSRGNYFDYHDLDTLEKEYMKADFGRSVAKREVTILRDQLREYEKAMPIYKLLQKPGMAETLKEMVSDYLQKKPE